jgi:geranylgeranyl pyrophosphate synthase
MSPGFVERTAARVDERLSEVFDRLASGMDDLFPAPPHRLLFEQVRDLTLRAGKRLRACLLVCGYRLLDGSGDRDDAFVAQA